MFQSLYLDEILYRIHLYFMDPIWGFITFRWLRNSNASQYLEQQGDIGTYSDAGFFDRIFPSPFFRIFESRPSNRPNSVEETLNPSDSRGMLETIIDIIFGRSDKEGIFELLFTTPFGLLFLAAIVSGFIYYVINKRFDFLSAKESILYNIAHGPEPEVATAPVNDKATRWNAITKKIESDSQDLWKIAIMDADILLDEVLREKGYIEDTLADKLKSAADEYKDVIQYAWDGHIVRNNIAHDATYELTQRTAEQTIKSYERFFQAIY